MSKDKPIIGIMTGSFVSDYPRTMVTKLYEGLKDKNVELRLYTGLDTNEIFERAGSERAQLEGLYDEGFDIHWLSLFEYSRFEDIDLLVITYGNIIASHPTVESGAFLSTLPDVPVITLGTDIESKGGAYVISDNYESMKQCVAHLIEKHGYRNIGFISGPKESESANLRMEAYLDAMREHDVPVNGNMIGYGDYLNNVDEVVEGLFKKNPGMQAIASSNDEMCNAIYRVAEKRGIQIGKDLAVTGFDDADFAEFMTPPLTTVKQDYDRMVEEAISLIDDFISGRGLKSCKIPAKLVKRASCGCQIKSTNDDMSHSIATGQYIRYEDVYRIQLQNLLSAVLLRNLILESANRRSFFEKLATEMYASGAKSSYVFLADEPVEVGNSAAFELPDGMRMFMRQNGDSWQGFDLYDAPRVRHGELAQVMEGTDRRLVVSLLLFYRNEQYGTLLVETEPRNIRNFYSLSIQIGSAIRYLILALRQQEMNKKLAEQNQILDFAAYHDKLTGLYNRAGVMSQMINFLHEKEGADKFVAIMADLDHLKQINDTFGHDAGDSAIKMVAKILKDVLPDGSPIGRSGGDEFTGIFIPQYEGQEKDIQQKVKEKCEEYNDKSQKPYYLGISVGCEAFVHTQQTVLADEMKKADNALYEAKKLRRSNVIR